MLRSIVHSVARFFRIFRLTIILLIIIVSVRWLLFEPFRVSSISMEGALRDGDYVLISKCTYGATLPEVVKVPFVDYDNLMFRLFEWQPYINLHLPYYRLPGVSKIRYGDIVAFYLPVEEREATSLKTIYIKRCLGLPGDTIWIDNKGIYTNSVRSSAEVFNEIQQKVKVTLSTPIEALTDEIGIYNPRTQVLPNYKRDFSNKRFEYDLLIGQSGKMRLSKQKAVISLLEENDEGNFVDLDVYPHSGLFKWNLDNTGKFQIPFRGLTVSLDKLGIAMYGELLLRYESDELEIVNGQMLEHGMVIDSFTFEKDYFYMVGDNRDASFDSRFWGVVPEDHIIGKASVTLLSMSRPFYGILSDIQ